MDVLVKLTARDYLLLCRLDYNLSRFEIEDRKGLEIVILSSLFAILHGEKLDTFSKAETEQEPGRLLTTTSPSPKPGVKRRNSDEVETVRLNASSLGCGRRI